MGLTTSPVMKKDGTVRRAIYFRVLNLHTTLNNAQANMIIPVKKECQIMTAFECCFCLLEFQQMPFGLKV